MRMMLSSKHLKIALNILKFWQPTVSHQHRDSDSVRVEENLCSVPLKNHSKIFLFSTTTTERYARALEDDEVV